MKSLRLWHWNSFISRICLTPIHDNTAFGISFIFGYLVGPFFRHGDVLDQLLNGVNFINLDTKLAQRARTFLLLLILVWKNGLRVGLLLIHFKIIDEKFLPRLEIVQQHHQLVRVVHCVCEILWNVVNWVQVTYVLQGLPWFVNLKVSKKM